MPITSSTNRFGGEKVDVTFPSHDYNQQQQSLDEQLDWLTVEHDDVREEILDRMKRPRFHPSMAVIDQWEREAIARIRLEAFQARRKLLDALDQHTLNANKTLNTLTPALREARHGIQPFDQNHIREWASLLQDLKKVPDLPIRKVKGETYDEWFLFTDTSRKM